MHVLDCNNLKRMRIWKIIINITLDIFYIWWHQQQQHFGLKTYRKLWTKIINILLLLIQCFMVHPYVANTTPVSFLNDVVDPNHVSSFYGVILPIHLSQFNAHLTKQFQTHLSMITIKGLQIYVQFSMYNNMLINLTLNYWILIK